MAAIGVVFVAITATGDGPIWFIPVWTACLAWSAYWFLLRSGLRLEMTSERMRIVLGLGERTIRLSDIDAVATSRMASNAVLLRTRQHRPVVVVMAKGLGEFLDELERREPQIEMARPKLLSRLETARGRSRLTRN